MSSAESTAFARPDVERILAGLKPFQRRSAAYVFERLYGPGYTRRFLLADEVGLGKTVVARGVIARAIDHLWDKVQRLDIVYICSNHDIARQNINRLNITGRQDFSLASRITLLPIEEYGKERPADRRLNFVSFTPGTSFDLKSSLGVSHERALLYHLVKKPWQLNGTAPLNVLQGTVRVASSFRRQVDGFHQWYSIDESMADEFSKALQKQPGLREEFEWLCQQFHRADARVATDAWRRRNHLVGELRSLLARTCLHSLQPDLIILDEFQRFKHLLSRESEAGQLAHDLFHYSDDHSEARVLLLSATPYKMYTMGHELAEEHHYSDFLNTLSFLLHDPDELARVEQLLQDYRRLLYRLTDGDTHELARVRDELEQRLRAVICRTERLAVTADRSGMLQEIPSELRLEPADVASYVSLQRIARALEHHDTLEYWKSAPYLLSFMDEYALKQDLKEQLDDPTLYEAMKLAQCGGFNLPWESVRRFGDIDPRNPRLRCLMESTIDAGAWRALWVAPSLPYYDLAGPVAELHQRGFTKRLVFSSWQVVPKAVATLLSYAAESRMMLGFDPAAENTTEARKAQRALLNFGRSEGRLRGMPVLGLLYPSTYLAERFDPLRIMCDQSEGCRLTAEEVVGLAESILSDDLAKLVAGAPTTGAVDESWYWAAPILLDLRHDRERTEAWWTGETLSQDWSGLEEDEQDDDEPSAGTESDAESGESAWRLHIEEARKLLAKGADLGRPPADLARVVAELAVAGPGVCALRAVARITGGSAVLHEADRRHGAGRVGWAFRSLFNSPDVMSLIRGMNREEPYWRRVLEYCVDGCLQAVLDEYAHVLREWLGDAVAEPEKVAGDVATAMAAALTLRVANPGVDHITIDDQSKTIRIENNRWRARFAMRFGDEKDEGRTVSRADQVRKAFNSPFWPFVLITTSIGQEGLDFHNYCHAVVHWNLPSNPVDLEQREGRVHRYKGHAVRRNVARRFASQVSRIAGDDPWERLFSLAAEECGDASAGLAPYWVFTVEGGATIERHVLALPLSREAEHLPALRSSLAVYRMVFGQPRQDDLTSFLLQALGREMLATTMSRLTLDLSPQGVRNEQRASELPA